MVFFWRGPLGPSRLLTIIPRGLRRRSLTNGSSRRAYLPHTDSFKRTTGLSLVQWGGYGVKVPFLGQHAAGTIDAAPPAAATAPAATTTAGSAEAAAATCTAKSSTGNSVVCVSACLSPFVSAAAEMGSSEARVFAVREALAAFSEASESAEAAGGPIKYFFDLTDPAYRVLFRQAIPATPAAAAAAATAGPWQQQPAWGTLGSPFYVLLLQALRAVAAVEDGLASSSSSNNNNSSSVETVAAEVAAIWQLQVNKDLRCLRLAAEALQGIGCPSAADPDKSAAAAPAAAAAAGTAAVAAGCTPAAPGVVGGAPHLHAEEINAAAVALLCSAAEAATLLAEMQLKHSVRDAVPTLLLILERVRLSRSLPPHLHVRQQEPDMLLQQKTQVAFSPLAADATAAAAAGVQCLHALGRCHLFSEELLKVVSTDHLHSTDPDSLSLYLFECGRMGLRCKRWTDACFDRATDAVTEMSPPSLLLACAGLYRFCTEWKAFYTKATPRLLCLLEGMDFYQLRLMLRIVKHLDPSFKDADMTRLARSAASLLNSRVPYLVPQQLCCIASFVERRCMDTPGEYLTLTRSVVAALETTDPARRAADGGAAAAGAAADCDPLALIHPLHDLVDVVDCLASHGLQSSLVPRIEAILSSRFTEIEYSVSFTLWLVCLDAFSRVEGYYPRCLLQRILTSICSSEDRSTGGWGADTPSLLNSLSVLQRLKFMQALSRLSFFAPPIARLWCSSVEREKSLFRTLRDAVTCVFPLSLAVYVHPVLFGRAFCFVESTCNKGRPGAGLHASDRHLEFLFLSHLCWAFLIAEMQGRPSFLFLVDRALAAASPVGGSASFFEPVGALTTADSSSSSAFSLPWRQADVAMPAEQQKLVAATGGDGDRPFPMALTALDSIIYASHCQPTALLQQVSRLLQLEAPQLAAASTQKGTLNSLAAALVRWKAERHGKEIRRFLQEVKNVATKGRIAFQHANEGGPLSPAPQFGHQWPFSEVSLWVEGIPVVLMAEQEGLRLSANFEGRQRSYNTGHKYLLLRAFKALGLPKVASLDPEEWQAAQTSQQKEALLRRKLAL